MNEEHLEPGEYYIDSPEQSRDLQERAAKQGWKWGAYPLGTILFIKYSRYYNIVLEPDGVMRTKVYIPRRGRPTKEGGKSC